MGSPMVCSGVPGGAWRLAAQAVPDQPNDAPEADGTEASPAPSVLDAVSP